MKPSVVPTLMEKYLQISDFIAHILDNTDDFLQDQLRNIRKREEEDTIIRKFLLTFLLAIQDSINYDNTVMVLIDNNVHELIIDELFDQTDDAIKQGEDSDDEKVNFKKKTTVLPD